MSPRTLFEHELGQLRDDLKKMCFQVEAVYDRLFSAMAVKDGETIFNILEQDRVVKDMEKSIESRCLSLITKQHPIARDLRTVSASLKVVTDIKRVGDIVTDMAELIIRLQMKDVSIYSENLPLMIKETKALLHSAVGAFLRRNQEEAENVIAGDDKVDDLFNKVKDDLVAHLKEGTANADDCIDILMIAKYLEKIADHAVNVGEWEIFQETGNMSDTRIL
ncbi:MAG: phosphate signaling complex protein PhoU [Lachnospiraceae bacterium]|nr:phosphate signaling complex protein PhoU [Lachnospiraceae bacterium]MDD6627151.1 phosphate signaling complex protein PhoU [Lachnospiraceae bacterium]